MRFEELDTRLRAFETNDDHCVLPDLHIVVQLDGRGFTRQTREVWKLDAPFDSRFRDHMLDTVAHVIDYFRWRHEDAHRNALNAHGYWLLRGQGTSAQAATAALAGLSVSDKNELLFRGGVHMLKLNRGGGVVRRVGLIGLACLALGGAGMVGAAHAQDISLTAAQRTELLQAHNRWRARVRVPPLAWSNELAQSAGRWAATLARNGVNGQCDFTHSDTRDVGENLYWLSPIRWNSGKTVVQEFNPAQVVEAWGRESDDYQFESNTCRPGKTCGHYTQLVWKDTREVGCALRVCSAKDQVWVCQYRPAGNFVGEWPY